jgi:uncharacterized SAM-binding protein YcdF (DUF218 family)
MKKFWGKKWVKVCSVFLVIFLLLFAFRNRILHGIGNWLVKSDELILTDACFVLGGNSYERGLAAVVVYEKFPDQQFVATGGNYPYQILCLDTSMFEAELTKHMMVSKGVPSTQVAILTSAHSTMEESEEILSYCKTNNLTDVTVISSSFHLRRVRWVFEEKFESAGIRVHFHGATAIEYDESNWWQNEEGLIMTNNEIVKLFYYLIKY